MHKPEFFKLTQKYYLIYISKKNIFLEKIDISQRLPKPRQNDSLLLSQFYTRSSKMTKKQFYPNWKEIVVYSDKGTQPEILVETEKYKAVIGGLVAGNQMPPHAEGPAIFHFLEGSGWVTVDEERLAVNAGATVVVPDGAVRGIEAETQMAFLAVRLPQ
jgi:quercetin dioxygenase-like cupin family protein